MMGTHPAFSAEFYEFLVASRHVVNTLSNLHSVQEVDPEDTRRMVSLLGSLLESDMTRLEQAVKVLQEVGMAPQDILPLRPELVAAWKDLKNGGLQALTIYRSRFEAEVEHPLGGPYDLSPPLMARWVECSLEATP